MTRIGDPELAKSEATTPTTAAPSASGAFSGSEQLPAAPAAVGPVTVLAFLKHPDGVGAYAVVFHGIWGRIRL